MAKRVVNLKSPAGTKQEQERYPRSFLGLYAAIYMITANYATFMPVYLVHAGYSQSLTGLLLAVGLLVAAMAQPVWGLVSDRAASKNRVLKILLLGTAAVALIIPLNRSLFYLAGMIVLFSIFQASIYPLTDTIALEYLQTRRWRFGPIRLAGTLGFAGMSLFAGIVAQYDIRLIFGLCSLVALVGFFAACRTPVVSNLQHARRQVKPWLLLKNRPVMLLIAFNFMIQFTLGFYYSFFPIHFRQMGATSSVLGLAMFITAASELPFLLLADRIIRRLGVQRTMVLSGLIISLRWLLLHLVVSIPVIVAVNASHGLSFIVFSYCLAVFINQNVPDNLKASGQTLNALICMGLARIMGSVGGGFLSELVGIRQVFLDASLVGFVSVLVFGLIFAWQNKQKAASDLPADQA